MSEVYDPGSDPLIAQSPEVRAEIVKREFFRLVAQIELSDETATAYIESERSNILNDAIHSD